MYYYRHAIFLAFINTHVASLKYVCNASVDYRVKRVEYSSKIQSYTGNVQLSLDISKLMGLFFTSSLALRVIWTCKKVPNTKLLLEKAMKMYV